MANKISRNIIEVQTSTLKISVNEFKKNLTERINIGNELMLKNINNTPDFEKFKEDYGIWTSYNSEYLKQKFSNPNNEYKKSYDLAGQSAYAIFTSRDYSDPLTDLKDRIKLKIANLNKLIEVADLLPSTVEVLKENNQKSLIDRKSVFIVHGHDEIAKIKTAKFIQTIGLNPIILHEQANLGNTIIEKIEENSNVGFGLILYTACDIGASIKESKNLKNRARQNVVFEHGFLIGKIGRKNVCALVKGEIDTPNDISGIVYVKMDDDDAWFLKIAKELVNAGYSIQLENLIK